MRSTICEKTREDLVFHPFRMTDKNLININVVFCVTDIQGYVSVW